MYTGMSSVASAVNTRMMKAIINNKAEQDKHLQMKARIIKLNKEQEKARKHINDMLKQKTFMNNMHTEKSTRRD